MDNEDETYRTLRRWTFEQVEEDLYRLVNESHKAKNSKFDELCGWTFEEYENERDKRFPAKNGASKTFTKWDALKHIYYTFKHIWNAPWK